MKLKVIPIVAAMLGCCSSFSLYANPAKSAPFIGSEATQPLAIAMFIIIFLLLAVIAVLTKVIYVSYEDFRKKWIKNANTKTFSVFLIVLGLGTIAPGLAIAQGAAVSNPNLVDAASLIGGLSASTFYFLFGFILLELVIILGLLRIFFQLMAKKKAKSQEASQKIHWIEKINAAPSVKGISDEEIAMGHNFDGIEELDNPTPPWWRWGFVISVIIAVAYIWHYEISTTTPDQYGELELATEQADIAVKEYLANSANNVDENTVQFLNNPADLAAGQVIFTQMCAACHAPDGGGNEVGPNLTDEYWLHGGSINNIFKTIKYGVTEKGMKSWKDDYSPLQIAQLASYIKSLKGTSPANPKAPQGEKFVEEEETTEDESVTAEVAMLQ